MMKRQEKSKINNKLHVKKGDRVIVISGKDKGKIGSVSKERTTQVIQVDLARGTLKQTDAFVPKMIASTETPLLFGDQYH